MNPMNEDELLPPPTGPGLSADRRRQLRGHLMSEFARGPAAGARRIRLGWVALPALAGGLALSLVLAGGPVERGADSTRPVAAVVLDRAARAAEQQSAPAVRGDQFVYVKSLDDWAKSEGEAARDRELWRSVDGSRRELLLLDGHLPNPGGSDEHGEPEPVPYSGIGSYAYVAALPTDPDALLARIHADTAGLGPGPDEEAFRTVGDLLREQIAPPAVSAALYRAAAKIPGVTVIDSVTDAAGRPGIAVARRDGGGKVESQWIFDRADYTFLGERTVALADGSTFKKGDITGQMAVLARAIVDQPGTRP
ncbi:CU044_5270 family protein [Kitasatospora sp. NPDC057542]|uniref:CU044_5270 family protein n=1 Tax=Streptomycetaceae TaxID=2062 RepID=UPI0021E15E9A|nr:CU044_5270 family protein [Streptomyces sp. LS1784]